MDGNDAIRDSTSKLRKLASDDGELKSDEEKNENSPSPQSTGEPDACHSSPSSSSRAPSSSGLLHGARLPTYSTGSRVVDGAHRGILRKRRNVAIPNKPKPRKVAIPNKPKPRKLRKLAPDDGELKSDEEKNENNSSTSRAASGKDSLNENTYVSHLEEYLPYQGSSTEDYEDDHQTTSSDSAE